MENKLSVKNLTISFRTSSGKVQAVRDISFDLNEGETLCIVGESGSGKSVTSKAIMGILAGNSIVENGEIIYEGQDLLKIDEEDFHKIRGNKISMIFQDPMSSLNPIIKIGKQLTEAMILKGKARQKENKKNFNTKLKSLTENLILALGVNDSQKAKELAEMTAKFNKFEYKHLELENAFNKAVEACDLGSTEVDTLVFEIEKKLFKDIARRVKEIERYLVLCENPFVVYDENIAKAKELKQKLADQLKVALKPQEFDPLIPTLNEIKEIFEAGKVVEKPNFFAMGYYFTFPDKALDLKGDIRKNLPYSTVSENNAFLRKYLDDNFMLDFIAKSEKALEYANLYFIEKKKEAIEILKSSKESYIVPEDAILDKKVAYETYKNMKKAVDASINKLELTKDSPSYTFPVSIKSKVDMYFRGLKENDKEQAKYEKSCAKIDAIIAKGKVPEWKPVPPSIVDLKDTLVKIGNSIDSMVEHLEKLIDANSKVNYQEAAVALVDYLKKCAEGVVDKVTQKEAEKTAIRIMEEVGIPEARKRYKQYPFEFSGGMRQRIVIAIALASKPDILICDEPTTALDVTIQATILELINNLKKERNLSIIFITHDLGVVANMADKVAVMYAGKIVEYGSADDIFYNPAHPYTWALLSSMPDLDTNEALEAIPGTPPNMIYPPVGDAFAARNKYAMKIDFEKQPPMFKAGEGHYAATWLLHPDAPKVNPPKIVVDRIAKMKANSAKKKEGATDGK